MRLVVHGASPDATVLQRLSPSGQALRRAGTGSRLRGSLRLILCRRAPVRSLPADAVTALLQERLDPGAVTAGPIGVVACTGLLKGGLCRVVGIGRLLERVRPRLPLAQ